MVPLAAVTSRCEQCACVFLLIRRERLAACRPISVARGAGRSRTVVDRGNGHFHAARPSFVPPTLRSNSVVVLGCGVKRKGGGTRHRVTARLEILGSAGLMCSPCTGDARIVDTTG